MLSSVSYCLCFFMQHYGIPQHFGLFYAMGIALVMEGVLSACYHVCPSYSNFQFGESDYTNIVLFVFFQLPLFTDR